MKFFTFFGYITNSQCDQLPNGLIAQSVEHCTGIAGISGFNFTTAQVLCITAMINHKLNINEIIGNVNIDVKTQGNDQFFSPNVVMLMLLCCYRDDICLQTLFLLFKCSKYSTKLNFFFTSRLAY